MHGRVRIIGTRDLVVNPSHGEQFSCRVGEFLLCSGDGHRQECGRRVTSTAKPAVASPEHEGLGLAVHLGVFAMIEEDFRLVIINDDPDDVALLRECTICGFERKVTFVVAGSGEEGVQACLGSGARGRIA